MVHVAVRAGTQQEDLPVGPLGTMALFWTLCGRCSELIYSG